MRYFENCNKGTLIFIFCSWWATSLCAPPQFEHCWQRALKYNIRINLPTNLHVLTRPNGIFNGINARPNGIFSGINARPNGIFSGINNRANKPCDFFFISCLSQNRNKIVKALSEFTFEKAAEERRSGLWQKEGWQWG